MLLPTYALDSLGIRTEPSTARIGTSDARSIAMFAALGFGFDRTVAVFDDVEMRIFGLVEMS